jgi:hypothetical protein
MLRSGETLMSLNKVAWPLLAAAIMAGGAAPALADGPGYKAPKASFTRVKPDAAFRDAVGLVRAALAGGNADVIAAQFPKGFRIVSPGIDPTFRYGYSDAGEGRKLLFAIGMAGATAEYPPENGKSSFDVTVDQGVIALRDALDKPHWGGDPNLKGELCSHGGHALDIKASKVAAKVVGMEASGLRVVTKPVPASLTPGGAAAAELKPGIAYFVDYKDRTVTENGVQAIRLPDGRTVYVAGETLDTPLNSGLCFKKVDGRWQPSSFMMPTL